MNTVKTNNIYFWQHPVVPWILFYYSLETMNYKVYFSKAKAYYFGECISKYLFTSMLGSVWKSRRMNLDC